MSTTDWPALDYLAMAEQLGAAIAERDADDSPTWSKLYEVFLEADRACKATTTNAEYDLGVGAYNDAEEALCRYVPRNWIERTAKVLWMDAHPNLPDDLFRAALLTLVGLTPEEVDGATAEVGLEDEEEVAPFYMQEGFNPLHALGLRDPNASDEENAAAAKKEAELGGWVASILDDD